MRHGLCLVKSAPMSSSISAFGTLSYIFVNELRARYEMARVVSPGRCSEVRRKCSPASWKQYFESDPSWTKLSEKQEEAVDKAAQGDNVFLTGAAGTGKSMTLRHIVQLLVELHGESKVLVTASTGVAARNSGGVTLHSALRVGALSESTTQEQMMACVWQKMHRCNHGNFQLCLS